MHSAPAMLMGWRRLASHEWINSMETWPHLLEPGNKNLYKIPRQRSLEQLSLPESPPMWELLFFLPL
jgi:hypothetical protein